MQAHLRLRLPLLAAEAARPVTEASDAVFDGVFLLEDEIRPHLFLPLPLVTVLVQVLADGVRFGPATGQGVRRVLAGLWAFFFQRNVQDGRKGRSVWPLARWRLV